LTEPAAPAPTRLTARRWTYAVLILAFLFVLMPFLFWRATWFGRPLDDVQLRAALSPSARPRDTQHALDQIEAGIRSGSPSVRQWYPELLDLAHSPVQQIRLTDAWVMGQDNTSPKFHTALLGLLDDPDQMVSRNAALALVRFHDVAGHGQILAMLRPYAVVAPYGGKLDQRLKVSDTVNPGTLLGRIESAAGVQQEMRVVVPGTLAQWLVADRTAVAAGQPVALLRPSQEMVWEALRALFLIGMPADLPDVEQYTHPVDGISSETQKQANLTVEAIRRRSPQ
jgi:hypothetical protein